jgi:hypothetical protein
MIHSLSLTGHRPIALYLAFPAHTERASEQKKGP